MSRTDTSNVSCPPPLRLVFNQPAVKLVCHTHTGAVVYALCGFLGAKSVLEFWHRIRGLDSTATRSVDDNGKQGLTGSTLVLPSLSLEFFQSPLGQETIRALVAKDWRSGAMRHPDMHLLRQLVDCFFDCLTYLRTKDQG